MSGRWESCEVPEDLPVTDRFVSRTVEGREEVPRGGEVGQESVGSGGGGGRHETGEVWMTVVGSISSVRHHL